MPTSCGSPVWVGRAAARPTSALFHSGGPDAGGRRCGSRERERHRTGSELDGDRLDLGVGLENLVAHLAAPAGLLVAAERQGGVEDVVAVDPHSAGPGKAAMDEATATPITPPRFCEVLSRPEATPASRSVTPVSAPMEIGMNAKAVPTPATNNGPARSGQKLPWGGAWAAHSIPAPMRAIPKAMTALAEVRVTIFWERPANAREVTDAVIQAPPGRQSGKPEHLLHV